MKEFTMVIPTYWGRSGDQLVGSEKIVFDHPTPLDSEGTLGRFLESLNIFDDFQGQVAMITVANDPAISEDVRLRVDEIIAPYKNKFNVVNFSQKTIETLKGICREKGVSDDAIDLLNVNNYAAVRNMCSMAGLLNASPATIFIDDDEVFIDKDFLNKVDQFIGTDHEGDTIDALAGYYLQPDTYHLDESKTPAWRKAYWDNARAMNEAFEKYVDNEPRIKPTSFVFGGNMTLTLDAIRKVPFDPKITRGEDMDFMMNLKVHGITFYIDRELSIKHLPPGSDRPAWKKVREDIIRFLYERKKVQDHEELKLEDYEPYPSRFLADDLDERIIKTCELLKADYEQKGEEENAQACQENIDLAKENPFKDFDTKAWLKKVTADWQELTAALEGVGIPQD